MSEVTIGEKFIEASRSKLRVALEPSDTANTMYNFSGVLCVDDLWAVPENVFQNIFNRLVEDAEQTTNIKQLFKKRTRKTDAQKELQLTIEIMEYIAAVRQEEKDAAKALNKKKADREKLLEQLEKRDEEDLGAMSREEILAKLEELG